jgi:hypothetical protein
MQNTSRGICAVLVLSGALSLIAGQLAAQGSNPVATPNKESAPPAGRVENTPWQAESRRWSSEESRLPIPPEVPKAERVDPGK